MAQRIVDQVPWMDFDDKSIMCRFEDLGSRGRGKAEEAVAKLFALINADGVEEKSRNHGRLR